MSQDSKNVSNLVQYNEKVQALQKMLEDKVEEIFEEFSCGLKKNSKMFVGACPVHGGDNPSGINVYHTLSGSNTVFNWRCNTRHCETYFKKTVIGLIRGILSHQEYGWSGSGQTVNWKDTIKWCEDFLHVKLNNIKIDYTTSEQQKFIRLQESLKESTVAEYLMAKPEVKTRLDIPAQFLIKKGYSEDILRKYDVGMNKKQNGEMYGRVIVPIYDETGYYVIGCSGRTIFPKCQICQSYHNGKCPDVGIRHLYTKWKNNSKFDKRFSLFNYWFAKKIIKKNKKIILVESPLNVFKLEEAGIHNSLAMFGCELSDFQQIILEKSGAFKIYILTDNDEAGILGRQKIRSKLDRTFNVEDLFVPKELNDVGEMKVESVKDLYGKYYD